MHIGRLLWATGPANKHIMVGCCERKAQRTSTDVCKSPCMIRLTLIDRTLVVKTTLLDIAQLSTLCICTLPMVAKTRLHPASAYEVNPVALHRSFQFYQTHQSISLFPPGHAHGENRRQSSQPIVDLSCNGFSKDERG